MRYLDASALLLLLGAAVAAEAEVLRFHGIDHGDVTITGNTLGLAKATGANGPGTRDGIGTFITTNLASSDLTPPANPSWPAGTTANWSSNASTASLSLPGGAAVLYAELVWGGSTSYGVEDVTSTLNVSILLQGPGGSCGSVAPDPATASTISQNNGLFVANYYMRSADVTACVSAQGSGTYTVSGVPATQHESINTLNAAGWAMVVAYRDAASPWRDLAVIVDGAFVDESTASVSSVGGLDTPAAGAVSGRLVAAALEGDANAGGDQLRVRPAGGTFVALSGPNNPLANFFASQINDADGALDTSGSFGGVNHSAATGTQVTGARQGFDTTGVALSNGVGHLGNAQTGAEIEVTSSGDDALLSLAFGLAVDRAAAPVPGLSPSALLLLTAVILGVVVFGVPRLQHRRASPAK